MKMENIKQPAEQSTEGQEAMGIPEHPELEPEPGLQEVPHEEQNPSKREVTNISDIDSFLDGQEKKDHERLP